MDWIEKAYREHYGIGADVLLSAETNRFLASLRAAEPKGVRMWTTPKWRDGCGYGLWIGPGSTADLIAVDVREVEAEEPEPKVEPKTHTESHGPKPETKPASIYTEEDMAWYRAFADHLRYSKSHAPKPEEPKMFETYRLGETKFERCGNETRSLREGRFYVCAGGSLPFMAMADRVAPEDYYPLRIVGGDEEYDPNVLALARALHDLVEHAKGNRP